MEIHKIKIYPILAFVILFLNSCNSDKKELKITDKNQVIKTSSDCPDYLFKNKYANLSYQIYWHKDCHIQNVSLIFEI